MAAWRCIWSARCSLRIAFRGFVAIVGTMMLAGAVNTSIVGSNGVSEPSFRRRDPAALVSPSRIGSFGTTHRILNLVVGLQIVTILLSRGNIFVLGEAYAFGVMWSFAMKGLAVLVLRYKHRGESGNFACLSISGSASVEIPVGSWVDHTDACRVVS